LPLTHAIIRADGTKIGTAAGAGGPAKPYSTQQDDTTFTPTPVQTPTITSISAPLPSSTKSSGGSSAAAAWSDTTGCPTDLISGEQSVLPSSAFFEVEDASTTFGILTDPGLNPGMHPSCAFEISTSVSEVVEEIFINMPASYLGTFASRMESDGFTVAASNSTSDTMVSGNVTDTLSYFPPSSQSPYTYVIAIG